MEQPFAVEFDLAGPIVMDHGINFAGLLARRLYDQSDDDPLPRVPLRQVEGIFAGSDLFAVGASLDYPLPFVRSLRPTAMPHELALHERRSRRPLTKITLRDERKNLLDHRRATSVPCVVAFGTGDMTAVEALLDGLTHIGAKRSGGHGEVSAIRITPLDHPHAGFADRHGRPMRATPLPVWQAMNLPPAPVRSLVARLPRWAAPREPCVGPREWRMDFAALDQEIGA